jgi:hypothetical protein
MGTGFVVLAALVLTLLAPRAARAIAATAVKVENTRSAPVPNQDVDIAARHPYTAECFTNSPSSEGGQFGCNPAPAPPASGFETVIQNVSVGISALAGTGMPVAVGLMLNTAGTQFNPALAFTPQSSGFGRSVSPRRSTWTPTP